MAKVNVKKGQNKPSNLVINQVTVSQVQRNQVDIDKWRSALRSAESIMSPNRSALYDLYSDVSLDTHLTAVISKRKTAILNSPIAFTRENEEDEAIMGQLHSPWFISFLDDLLDTLFWGHSLFQFYTDGQWVGYDLIPRKHVKPETGIIINSQNDQSGVSFRDGSYPNILEGGKANTLGLLLKAAPYVIYKRNCMADYAQFAEIFGQPMREGTYDGYDELARVKLKKDLEDMGSSAIFIHPEGTKIDIKESPFKSASSDLYSSLIKLCNAELSKLILGNTLTTDQGDKGSQALGEVHMDAEATIIEHDKKFVLNVLNYNLSDILTGLGFNTLNGRFHFVDSQQIDLTKRITIDMRVATRVPVGDDYFYETYGIPKPDNYEQLKKELEQKTALAEAREPAVDPKAQNRARFPFFA